MVNRKYSAAQLLDIHKAFKAALKYLSVTYSDEYGPVVCKHEYICHAIARAATNGNITREAKILSREVLQDRLGECSDYLQWLRKKHPELNDAINDDRDVNFGRKAQRARRRWLKSLIAEFAPA